jgi:Flp pilus assembly protein TadG
VLGVLCRRARSGAPDQGAAAVEFALVVPILLMLVFGILSFGVLFAQSLALSNSARESARGAVVAAQAADRETCQDIADQIRSTAGTIALDSTAIQVKVWLKSDAGATTPDWSTASPLCTGTTAGASSMTSGGATKPCEGATTDDAQLVVRTRYVGSLVIPLVVANPSFDLDSVGVYRCEYRGA